MYSKRLKEIRGQQNLLQKCLALYLGIEEITYTHYESEYFILPAKYLSEISNYLKVSVDYLFELTDVVIYENYNTKINREVVGLRLKEFRKENKLTQVKLAQILNSSQSTLADYERGKNLIATPFLYTICKKYQISADYLLGKVDEPKYLK